MKREARRMLADFRLKEFAVESEIKNIFFFIISASYIFKKLS